jgi:hypothetical protein
VRDVIDTQTDDPEGCTQKTAHDQERQSSDRPLTKVGKPTSSCHDACRYKGEEDENGNEHRWIVIEASDGYEHPCPVLDILSV